MPRRALTAEDVEPSPVCSPVDPSIVSTWEVVHLHRNGDSNWGSPWFAVIHADGTPNLEVSGLCGMAGYCQRGFRLSPEQLVVLAQVLGWSVPASVDLDACLRPGRTYLLSTEQVADVLSELMNGAPAPAYTGS